MTMVPFFPYTTLFRSSRSAVRAAVPPLGTRLNRSNDSDWSESCWTSPKSSVSASRSLSPANRSEEHTCELQSPCNLVCRLLLEKKKKSIHIASTEDEI